MSEQRGNLLVPTNQNLLIVPLTEVCLLSVAHNMANLELSGGQQKE